MNRLPFDKQVHCVSALCEGMSIRSTERLTGVHRDTIMRLGARIGTACAQMHDAIVRDLRVSQIQLDELWAFIGCKQRNVGYLDPPERGDCYTFIALDAVNKAILSYQSGKRDSTTTRIFLHDLRARVLGAPIISSDAFPPYEQEVAIAFGEDCHYGMIRKHYVAEPANEASRRYSPGVVVGIEKRLVIGEPPNFLICTSHAERQNLSVRMASRRFTRLTNGFSKKAANHAAAVSLYVGHYNWCRVHEALRTTPAHALGLTNHVWSIAELIERVTSLPPPSPPGRRIGRLRVIDGGRR
ncbi:MAG: transposase [Hyphomicrobiaceae bacterium]|nr:MAG: transposase [Hyphomicrobiaceae bacterium]